MGNGIEYRTARNLKEKVMEMRKKWNEKRVYDVRLINYVYKLNWRFFVVFNDIINKNSSSNQAR